MDDIHPAAYAEHLRLRPSVYSVVKGGELWLVLLQPSRNSQSFGRVNSGKRSMLRKLATGPCTPAELWAVGRRFWKKRELLAFLEGLQVGGWLMTTVSYRGAALYTIQPLWRPSSAAPGAARDDLVLSRFTVLCRDGDEMVAESPLASARMQMHDPRVMSLLGTLAHPVPADLTSGPLPPEVMARMLSDLRQAGLAVAPGSPAESGQPLLQWRPHELWFHRRSRMGNGGYGGLGYGQTQWAKGRFGPLPARREPFHGPTIDLRRPDIDRLRRNDPPLSAVIEDRRSVRVHDDGNPISAEQLSELLFRCARIRGLREADGAEYLSTPYPAGGAACELELYPIARHVAGLAPGMYHYDAHEHRLRLVQGLTAPVIRLLRTASHAAMVPTLPQVLIVMAARFGRLAWSYEEMPYALTLKHVGVLYQTIYLVATSMGLAACGLGGGDAAAFTEATGLDYATESSVGEFMLGSRPA